MYQDYLIPKYEEAYPKLTVIKTTKKPLQAKQRLNKQKREKQAFAISHPNKIIPFTNKNLETKEQFTGISKTMDTLFKGVSSIVTAYGPIIATVAVIALGIFALSKYLKEQDGSYDSYDGYYSGDSTGKLSDEGKASIKNEEGCYLYTYDDKRKVGKDGRKPPLMPGDKIYGTPTIGYGHTGPDVRPGMKITQQQADAWFDKDIARFEKRVNEQLKQKGITTKISQKQFDAMVEYAYMSGSLGPKFLERLKVGDYKGASEELSFKNNQNGARTVRLRSKFMSDVNDDNTLKSDVELVKGSDAGPIQRYKNGARIGNYTMSNPVSHDGEHYIDLSARAKAYLQDSGGDGLVTSGAEGSHAKGIVSHGKGNKLDIVARNKNVNGWARTAIPFIKNKNTAFINFEDFSNSYFAQVKAEIIRLDPSLKDKFTEKSHYSFDSAHRFIFNWQNPDHKGAPQLHLDIGIIPNAYINQTHQKENSSDNTKKVQDQSKKVNQTQNKPNPQTKQQPKPTTQNKSQPKKPVTITKQPTKPKTSANNQHAFKSTNTPSALDNIKQQNENYKRERK